MPLRLNLLGGIRVESDGAAKTGPGTQRRRLAILALLALAARRTLARERIIGFLWPEHSPESARRVLSEAVYVLRREFGEDIITTTGDELTLGAAMSCDVDEFMKAIAAGCRAEAVQLYGGPLLDGWFIREAPEFERWVEGERTRLAGLHARALQDLAEHDEATDEWRDAAAHWQSIIRLDPYNSTAALRAARALANAGEQASALQALRSHAEFLKNELGVEPDGELAALELKIRNGDVRVRRNSPLPRAVSVVPPEPTVASDDVTPPVDRRSRRPRMRTLAFVSFVVVAAVLALASSGLTTVIRDRFARQANASGETMDALDRRRIAVLYFEDHSTAHDLGYLADGLTEYLINELSDVRGLHVTSPDAVRQLREVSSDSVARALHVRTIVEANVERSKGLIRVSARLIDASNQEQVGAMVVEAPVGETFALEDGLSARVAVELVRWIGRAVRLGEARDAAHSGGRSNRALDLVLRAERLRKDAEEARVSATKDSAAVEKARAALRQADSLLAESEAIDRTWAIPVIERGWVVLLSGLLENGTARVVALAPGLAHAERAITLLEAQSRIDSSTMARALYLRGSLRVRSATAVQTFRPESSSIRLGVEDLQAAVRFDSTEAGAWSALAMPRWLGGDFKGAEVAAARALQADAYLEDAPAVLGWAWRGANALGDHADAERWCARGRQQFPQDWHFVECELTIMRLDVAGLSGVRPDTARAWALVRELERIDPTARARVSGHRYSPIFRRMVAAMVSAAAGDAALARATLARARDEVKGDAELSTDLLYETACLHFVLGQRDEGERELAAYLRARPDAAGFLRNDATVKRLRGAGAPAI